MPQAWPSASAAHHGHVLAWHVAQMTAVIDETAPPFGGAADRAQVSVVDAVRAWSERIGLGNYGIACSGGPDSLALADAAIEVLGGARVVVATIDHALQAGSADVAARVAAWATARGADAIVRRVDLELGANEASARVARYAALDAIADERALACVMLGHTARDQAETVLARILRGTGPAGLAGMPARRGRYVRPLLDLSRAAIDAHVAARALPAWHDPHNVDPRYQRARLRADVMPALRRENPALDDALLRLAAATRTWIDAIDERARPLSVLPIDCRVLAREPVAVRCRAIHLALTDLDLDFSHVAAIDALVIAPSKGEVGVDVPGGRVVKTYDHLDRARAIEVVPLVAPAGPYVVRAWRPGDRMRTRPRGSSVKLSDLYGERKVPRAARRVARVVVHTTDSRIVWAEHVGVAFGEPDEVTPTPSRSVGEF
jgi:tRNA(Ile)-lysidine synthase